MSAARSGMRWVPLSAMLTIAVGVATGWLAFRLQTQAFDYVYALLSPACFAMVCITALLGSPDHARWVVPLLLVTVVLHALNHPHTAMFSAVAATAGALAIVAALCHRKPLAIAGTLVCCVSISVSLLIALSEG